MDISLSLSLSLSLVFGQFKYKSIYKSVQYIFKNGHLSLSLSLSRQCFGDMQIYVY